MIQTFNKINKVKGELELPGDKSISHRSVIFSAMSKGKSILKNISDGEDVKSTIECCRQLGVQFKKNKNEIIVNGTGFKGFKSPSSFLNSGNSGTTARLLTGLLAAQDFSSTIIGDESLSRRPMLRIAEPLRIMGADIELSANKTLPIRISPSQIKNINYTLPVSSAQVKSCLILTGLHVDEQSMLIVKDETRDHTERLLNLKSEKSDAGWIISFSRKDYPFAQDYFIPGDISSASFFIVLTLLMPDSELLIKNISLNPTRSGFINVLKQMGANIIALNTSGSNNEPFGDLIIRSSQLHNVEIPLSTIPNIIDEIPILAAAGVFADGSIEIKGAEELRKKESDRINSLSDNFRRAGLSVDENDDGFRISGKVTVSQPLFNSFNDHRIAMAFSVFSLLLEDGGKVDNFECVKISNPKFLTQLNSVIR